MRMAWLSALVVTPTRELALQVETAVRTYGSFTRFRSIAIFGGVLVILMISVALLALGTIGSQYVRGGIQVYREYGTVDVGLWNARSKLLEWGGNASPRELFGTSCYLEIVENELLVWTDALLPGWRPKEDGFIVCCFMVAAAAACAARR